MRKENIGKEIRLIRKFNHLTLRDLSKMTGISYMRLGKYERGEEIPTENAVNIIEKSLNINFNDLGKVFEEINELFADFSDSLFYHTQNLDYFELKISKYKQVNGVIGSELDFNNAKILLMEYILKIINNDLDNAEKLEECLLEYFKNDSECNAMLYDYIGLKFRIKKEYKKAIVWQEKALNLTLDEKIIAMIYYHLTSSYTSVRKLLQSAASLEKANVLFSKHASYRRASFCLSEFALVLKATRQYDEAIEMFKKSLCGSEQLGFGNDIIAMDYRNMCWTMMLAKRYKEALEYLDEAKMKEPKHPLAVLYGIWCNLKLNNYNSAQEIINQNQQLKENSKYGIYFRLFVMLLKIGEGKPTKACLNLAMKVVDQLYDSDQYERCIFYIDIVLDLLDRNNDEISAIKYLKMKVNLLQNS